MRHSIFQVDAFATQLFTGNPAAVVSMDGFPPDGTMQAVAAENNLAETAFLVRDGNGYQLRWFTPVCEVPLCGHATLASAAVVMQRLDPTRDNVVFHTASGPLSVVRKDGQYVMSFPSRPSERIEGRQDLADALGCVPRELFVNAFNYLAVLDSATIVRNLSPAFEALACLDRPGVIVTASGDDEYDFVSRYFAPAKLHACVRAHLVPAALSRHSAGDTPTSFLNARLNAASDMYPTSCPTAATFIDPSARRRAAICMRQSAR
jgi:PhzF family phenazine biosynthesis protein